MERGDSKKIVGHVRGERERWGQRGEELEMEMEMEMEREQSTKVRVEVRPVHLDMYCSAP